MWVFSAVEIISGMMAEIKKPKPIIKELISKKPSSY